MPDRALARLLAAEFIGTFALVFAGCGAVMVDAQTGALGHVGVAITFGLVIMAMIYAVGHISGAHFNPAVSFVFALSRHFPWSRTFVYWRPRSSARSSLPRSCAAHSGTSHTSAPPCRAVRRASRSCGSSCSVFFLMFVIMAVATDTRAVGEAAAIAIGGTVGLDAMFGGPISGASMNPARSIGPTVVSGDLHALWLYILAPIIGTSLGALSYQLIRSEPHLLQLAGSSAAELEAREEELV